MSTIDKELTDKFIELAKQDIDHALQIATGIFVTIAVISVDLHGNAGDGKKQITIEGPDGQRKITIHAA